MIQIYDLNAIQDQEIFLRRDEVRDVSAPVADIIRTVRAEGDRALYEYGRRFDGAELSGLSVTGAPWSRWSRSSWPSCGRRRTTSGPTTQSRSERAL